MQTLWQDLRYALRQLRNAPGFAFTAIVTLALGIGATIGVYTLVDAILLRPLPYNDPSRLFLLESRDAEINYANLKQLAERSQGKLAIAAIADQWSAKLESNGSRVPVFVSEGSANLMEVLGVRPAMGRSFLADESESGKSHVLLLSDSVWRSAFHAAPNVAGKTASLRGEVYTVIGVMPRAFAMPMDTNGEVWTPASISPTQRTTLVDQAAATESENVPSDTLHVELAFLRPSPQVTAAEMRAEIATLQKQIASEHAGSALPSAFRTTPYLNALNHEAQKPLLLLLGVGASFWLLAILNVVSLMLARSMAREREFAVRSALGASRGRLLKQSVVESMFLSAAGSILGLGIATLAIKLLWHSISTSLPLTNRIHVDTRVVIGLIGISLLTGMLAGLLPALRASGRNVQHGLRGGASPLLRTDQHRLRSTLVAAQLMITVILLAGAGLFLRTVTALRDVPLGFAEQNVLTGGVMLHAPRSMEAADNKGPGVVQQVYLPLLNQVNHMPGVQSAAMSSVLPMRSEFQVSVIGNLDGKKDYGKYKADGRVASAGLPETFGIPMLRGRFFTDEDTVTSPRVLVVNEAFAKAYLNGQNPVGHTYGLGKGPLAAMRIVGEIGDVKQGDVKEATTPELYMCLSQMHPGDGFYDVVSAFMQVGIRARIPAQNLRKQFEVALDHVDPEAQTIGVKTIHEAVGRFLWQSEFDRSLA